MVQTAFTNYDIAGSFEPFPHPNTNQVNKKFTTDPTVTTFDIPRGFLISKDPADTTPTQWIVAKAASIRPFAMAFGYALKLLGGQSYILVDSQFQTPFAAVNTDTQVPACHYGICTMYIDGVVQPDDFVMPADGSTTHGGNPEVLGHVKKWNGSNRNTICGKYQHLIGQSGGKYLKTATPDLIGTLGRVFINAPGAQ